MNFELHVVIPLPDGKNNSREKEFTRYDHILQQAGTLYIWQHQIAHFHVVAGQIFIELVTIPQSKREVSVATN